MRNSFRSNSRFRLTPKRINFSVTISIWFSDQCLDWTKRQKWIFSDKDRRSTNERNFSFDDDAAAVSTRRLFQWKENDRIECSKSMFHFLIVKLNSSKNQTIVILAQNKESLGSVTFFTKKNFSYTIGSNVVRLSVPAWIVHPLVRSRNMRLRKQSRL